MKDNNEKFNFNTEATNCADLFNESIRIFSKYQVCFLEGCCLPESLVNTFIFITQEGSTSHKIICMKLLASYAIKGQIKTVSELQGIEYFRMAANLGDEDSIRYLATFNNEFAGDEISDQPASPSLTT